MEDLQNTFNAYVRRHCTIMYSTNKIDKQQDQYLDEQRLEPDIIYKKLHQLEYNLLKNSKVKYYK